MKLFKVSVWARDGEFGIRQIDSVEEAQIFLDGWTWEKRGPLYFAAVERLRSAEQGFLSVCR